MRRLRSRWILVFGACAAIACAPNAAGAPQAVDLEFSIGASDRFEGRAVLIANGGTAMITRKNFKVHAELDLITSAAPSGRPTFKLELGQGLSWGNDAPDAPDGCTNTPTTGLCTLPFDLRPEAGQTAVNFYFDVVAAQNGSYAYTGEIVSTADVDPVTTNNHSAITIAVNETTGGGGAGGGGGGSSGGGSAKVTAGSVKLSPAKPRAGSTVVASVRVTKGGSPVRPSGVTCSASVGGVKAKGGPKAASGVASCLFRTPKSAKGKSLAGSVSFRAGGSAFTKRFAVKLR